MAEQKEPEILQATKPSVQTIEKTEAVVTKHMLYVDQLPKLTSQPKNDLPKQTRSDLASRNLGADPVTNISTPLGFSKLAKSKQYIPHSFSEGEVEDLLNHRNEWNAEESLQNTEQSLLRNREEPVHAIPYAKYWVSIVLFMLVFLGVQSKNIH